MQHISSESTPIFSFCVCRRVRRGTRAAHAYMARDHEQTNVCKYSIFIGQLMKLEARTDARTLKLSSSEDAARARSHAKYDKRIWHADRMKKENINENSIQRKVWAPTASMELRELHATTANPLNQYELQNVEMLWLQRSLGECIALHFNDLTTFCALIESETHPRFLLEMVCGGRCVGTSGTKWK